MIDDLAPRKGHFSSSPWQRHGKTVPQKEYALKGHPELHSPFQFARNHEAPLQGLVVFITNHPHGVAMGCELPACGAEKLQLLIVGIIPRIGVFWMLGEGHPVDQSFRILQRTGEDFRRS